MKRRASWLAALCLALLILTNAASAQSLSGAGDDMRSRAALTAYAIKRGALKGRENKTTEDTANGRWRLRSPGYRPGCSAYVYEDGSLSCCYVPVDYVCVRPSVWISLTDPHQTVRQSDTDPVYHAASVRGYAGRPAHAGPLPRSGSGDHKAASKRQDRGSCFVE